jgi:hypothetical protein
MIKQHNGQLNRILLFDDESIVGECADTTILLHPSANEFSVWNLQNGYCLHQQTANAISEHQKNVWSLLSFRNMYLEYPVVDEEWLRARSDVFEVCVFPSPLSPFSFSISFLSSYSSLSLFVLSYLYMNIAILTMVQQTNSRIEYAHWPSTSDSAAISEEADGSMHLTSLDQLCVITLSPHAKYFKVTFPALASIHNNLSKTTFKYFWINQVFSLLLFPPRWRHPLYLLLCYKHGMFEFVPVVFLLHHTLFPFFSPSLLHIYCSSLLNHIQ